MTKLLIFQNNTYNNIMFKMKSEVTKRTEKFHQTCSHFLKSNPTRIYFSFLLRRYDRFIEFRIYFISSLCYSYMVLMTNILYSIHYLQSFTHATTVILLKYNSADVLSHTIVIHA